MTTRHSILDELHAIREQMLADAGGTLAGLVAKTQADQAKSGRTIVKTTDDSALHQSREAERSEVEDLSSRLGERERR